MENNFIKEPKIVGILSRMDLYCHVDHLTRICRKWQWPISIEIQASFYRNSSKSVSINQFGCRGENITITEATNHLHRKVLYTSSTQRFPIQSIHPSTYSTTVLHPSMTWYLGYSKIKIIQLKDFKECKFSCCSQNITADYLKRRVVMLKGPPPATRMLITSQTPPTLLCIPCTVQGRAG